MGSIYMSGYSPFTPSPGKTVSIAATTSSGATAINMATGLQTQIMVANSGTTVAFVNWATSAAVATSANIPIMPGHAVVLSIPATTASVAAIMASGTATIYFAPGIGE